MVSIDADVITWCQQQCIETVDFTQLIIIDEPFCLFSVINSYVIPSWYLQQESLQMAINYHDSLLPKYAGLNSTTWAILNNETQHGITWHLLSDGIDKGDIVRQVEFDIRKDDTAYSLNMECTKCAFQLFKEIVDDIDMHLAQSYAQNCMTPRTYYGKTSMPDNYAIISNLTDVSKVDRLSRALSFANTPNPVATMKIVVDGHCYILDDIYLEPFDQCIVVTDSKKNNIYMKTIRDIYGNIIVEPKSIYMISEEVLSKDDLSSLAKIKKNEMVCVDKIRKCIIDANYCKQHENIKLFTLAFNDQCSMHDENQLLFVVHYLLFRLLSDHDIITYYHPNKYSSLLRALIDERSFFNVDKSLDTASFKECLLDGFHQSIVATKDLDYRYLTQLKPHAIVSHSDDGIDLAPVFIKITDEALVVRSKTHEHFNDQLKGLWNRIDWSKDIDMIFSCIDRMTVKNNMSMFNKVNRVRYDHKNVLLLHELFERQAALTPDHIAVKSTDYLLSYHDLNMQSDKLARYIMALDHPKSTFIAMSVRQRCYLPLIILGILKSGSAFLPIDNQYPQERIQYILSDSKANIVIKDSLVDASQFQCAEVIDIDLVDLDSHAGNEIKKVSDCHLDDRAYMIYTSGTTGKPKGVIVSHRNIAVRMLDLLNTYQVNEKWRHLQYGSYSFDASLEEICLPLLAGGVVVVADEDTAKDPQMIINHITEYDITAINFVPSVLNLFLTLISKKNMPVCQSLECVISGGEALHVNTVRRFHQYFDCKLFNTYGPTENTIDSTYFLVGRNVSYDVIPIGQPLPNSTVYVYDEKMNLMGYEQVGELCVGGVGVAQGYHNSIELTGERFVNNPIPGSWDSILYKTGDFVYLNYNHELIYAGRKDDQVKIRGLRIELAEIQKVLLQDELIEHVLVCVQSNDQLGEFIAVYYVPKETGDRPIVRLRELALQELPGYMQPKTYTAIPTIPLTANGKVNYRGLPKPTFDLVDDVLEEDIQESEKQVLMLFQEILGLNNISIHHSFFDLGGHSLMAIQILLKLNNLYEEKIPLKVIFENTSVKALTAYLNDHCTKKDSLHAGTDMISFCQKRQSPFPASYLQEAIWFVDKMLPGNVAYDIPAIYRLDGSLNYEILNASIRYLLEENEILRVVFDDTDGAPFMRISNIPDQIVTFIDYNQESQHMGPDEFSLKLSSAISNKPYQLVSGPLYRFTVIKINQSHHYLLINIHHSIFDGVSSGLLTNKLTKIYNKLLLGKKISSVNAPQYIDYVLWRRDQLSKGISEQSIRYWEKQLQGIESIVELPLDYPRPKVLLLKGESLTFEIGKLTQGLLSKKCKQLKCSAYSILLSAFSILLYKYSRQETIILGTAISNRELIETQDMLGLFVSILPLKIDMQHTDLDTFVKNTSHYIMEALSHKDIVFEKLLNRLEIDRDTSRHPLFQIMFVMENMENEKLNFDGVCAKKLLPRHFESKYDLSLYIDDSHQTIRGRFEYNTSLFSSETVQSFLDHYLLILNAVVQEGVMHLDRMPLITRKDEQIIHQYNQTKKIFNNHDALLHQLFEKQCEQAPQGLALQAGGESVTYALLNHKANALADSLQKKGIMQGDVVAILMKKSIEQVVSALAILKLGATYLPLNGHDPVDRLNRILQKATVKLVLVTADFVPDISTKISKVSWQELPLCETLAITLQQTTNKNLAYIIFTSGSTGEPKGVMIPHKGAVNTILDINDRFHITASDKVYGISKLTFDLSVYDIFGTLACGACLVLPDSSAEKDPQIWAHDIKRYGVTIWNSVPALMQMLIEYIANKPNLVSSSIKLSLLSGDWIPLDLPDKIKQTFGSTSEVISLGGATEAAIWSILFPVDGVPPEWNSIPYGSPMANQSFYVLSDSLQPLPVGAIGELYIGGVGVAQGYFADPDRTRKSFIYSEHHQSYLYATGDLGRLHANGYIQFMGRKDNQVKLNGYRIELGEIQNQLLKHPEVNKAVVMISGVAPNYCLIAYIVGSNLDQNDVMAWLRKGLPTYMLPSQLIMLDHLPLTSNGKVDRKALPEPKALEDGDAMMTTTEQSLQRLWIKLLQVKSVHRQSHFFSIGGNSLLSVRLISQINKQYAINLSINTIFDYPVLSDMAQIIQLLLPVENHMNEEMTACETGVI